MQRAYQHSKAILHTNTGYNTEQVHAKLPIVQSVMCTTVSVTHFNRHIPDQKIPAMPGFL